MEKRKGKMNDLKVQGTNDVATLSKYSMVKQGYFRDNFLKYFVSKVARRAPIIHRSYYIRAKAIHFMVKGFLMNVSLGSLPKQILSLGAGFDTLFFNLNDEGLLKDTKYFEVDFPEVVKQKTSLILRHQPLSEVVGKVLTSPDWLDGGVLSEKYKLLGCNLKNLSGLEECLLKAGIDKSLPTLLLAEVVLTYIEPPQSSTAVIGWAEDFFASAMFVMNEQVSPNDPFGIKMMNHFKFSVGAPLHGTEAFPTRQSQIERFKKERWPVVQCPTLNFVYYDALPEEEKIWLETLEPFDEFEEWHLMCSHYIALVALKGSCQSLREHLFKERKGHHSLDARLDQEPQYPECKIHSMDVLSSPDRMKRFGHTATSFSDGRILLIGGFGVENGRHTRLNGLQLMQPVQGAWHCVEVTANSTSTLGSRVFHTASAFSDNSIIIHGGRTSPTKPCSETIKLSIMGNSGCRSSNSTAISIERSSETESNGLQSFYAYGQTCLECKGDLPTPRWRHTATRIVLPDEREHLLIFGGRTPSCLALGDSYLFDVQSNTWGQIYFDGDTAEPRHSHTACAWNHHVVLAGGLGSNLKALNTVQIIDTKARPMSLRTLAVDPPLEPRYSHTAHVVNDNLILVGGVSPKSSRTPGVVVLHLVTLVWTCFALPACTAPTLPFMLHNHCSVALDQSQQIMVLGGGGNCFSFGTHLNDALVVIDLPAL